MIVAWIEGLGGGGWEDEGRAERERRVVLIPVNEGNSQAPLAEPYSWNTNEYDLTWNVPLPF